MEFIDKNTEGRNKKAVRSLFIFIRVLVLIVLSLSFCYSYGQDIQWSVGYENNYQFNTEKFLDTDTYGNTFYAGTSYKPSETPFGQAFSYIAKFSPAGKTIWVDSIDIRGSVLKIKAAQQGTCLVIGTFRDSVQLGSTLLIDTAERKFIAKLNSRGIFLWAHKLPEGNKIGDIALLPDDEFYLTESSGIAAIDFGKDFIDPNTGFVGKFNSKGICIRALKISNTNDLFSYLRTDRKGNFYIAGDCRSAITLGIGTHTLFVRADGALIVKFDSLFNPLWTKTGYGTVDKEIIKGFDVDPEGNSYVAGNLFLAKLDALGNEIWMKHGKTKSEASFIKCSGLLVDYGGASYISGGTGESALTYDQFTISKPYSPFLIKFDADGNIIWGLSSEINPSDEHGQVAAICKNDSQNIFIAGNSTETYYKTFLTKLHDPAMDTATVIAAVSTGTNEKISNDIFTVFPNPNSGQFTIVFSSQDYGHFQVRLVNPSAQEIFADQVPSFEGEYRKEIDLSSGMKGIYYVEVVGASGKQVRKIIME